MDLSIIIVNYNTKMLTINAIDSLYNSNTNYQFEIIVIDNSSSDDSVKAIQDNFQELKVITNDQNLGFSKANNQGIKVAQGKYILLLNSDTIVERDTIEVMLKFMDSNANVGASGCKILLPSGELDKACRRGFPTPSAAFYYFSKIYKLFPGVKRFNQYHLNHLDPDEGCAVDSLVGAFMLIRKKTIDQVGLLDNRFFMYGEDIDMCYRIKEAGWQNYYYPYTFITHYKGASSKRKPIKIIYEFYRSMYIFHKKHLKKKHSIFTNSLVYIGICSKLFLSIANGLLKER